MYMILLLNTNYFEYSGPVQLANDIWKRSFSCMVRPTVYNQSRKRSFAMTIFEPDDFENARFAS